VLWCVLEEMLDVELMILGFVGVMVFVFVFMLVFYLLWKKKKK